MVAVAQFIPQDPKEQESVLAVLREHPELQDYILHVSDKAKEIFPDFRVTLDTVQYDEWDPPVTMTVWVPLRWPQFLEANQRFTHWLVHKADHDKELLFVMPMWDGPLESAP